MEKNLFKYYSLIVFVLSALCSAGQDYIIQRMTVSDGLPSDRINCVYEDSYGYLWIGSSNGLGRYDGKQFKNYGFPEGLPFLQISAIFEDSHHRLWIGAAKGIVQLLGNKFHAYRTNDKKDYTWTYGFYETAEKELWALTNKGIYHFDDSTWNQIAPYHIYKDVACKQIVQDRDALLFNYGNALLKRDSDNKWSTVAVSPNTSDYEYFNSLQRHGEQNYVSTRNQLYAIQDGKLVPLIADIPEVSGFNYFVDNDRCFVTIEGKGMYVHPLRSKNQPVSFLSYRSNFLFKMYKDFHDNLWLTSYEGLLKIQPKAFTDYQREIFPRPLKEIRNIISLYNDLLISSSSSGFHILNDYRLVDIPSEQYRNDMVEGYTDDDLGGTWMMTRKRRFLYIKAKQLSDYSHLVRKETNSPFYDIAVHPFTRKVYLCADSVLQVGDKDKMEVYRDADGNTIDNPISIVFTYTGIGIVNVLYKGVYFITKENKVIKAPPQLDIIDERVSGWIYPGIFGFMWVRNYGRGLVCFRVNERYEVTDVHQYTTREGLPSNDVLDITTDYQSRFWVVTNHGLAVMVFDKSKDTWDVYNVGKQKGIDFESWTDSRTAMDTFGNIWLSTTDNLIKIHPDQIQLKKEIPRVVIEEIQLDMKETDWSKSTDSVYSYFQLPYSPVFKYNQNSLGIRFNATNLAEFSPRLFSYMLEPLDTGWSEGSANTYVSLLRLSPGTYSFKVRVRNEDTDWSEPAEFSFSIQPPFWNNWWFRTLLIGLGASVIVFIYSRRIKAVREEARVQNQLKELEMKALKAQMNPHFIYNALNSIQSLIADGKNSDAISYIGTFSRLLRQVLEQSDSNVVSLEKELNTLKLYIQLESLRLNIDLKYSLTTDENVMTEYEKVPPLILQPFVENALWHGLSRKEGEKLLNISVSQTDDYIVCAITDNGIGREKAASFKKSSSAEMYASRGIDITIKRLIEFNRSKESPVVYKDLIDNNWTASGTQVNVYIKKQS